MVKQGKKIWTFITADYVFGHSLQEQTADVVTSMGGEVEGSVDCPRSPTRRISLASWLPRRRAAPRCWGWRMPARTR